MRDLLSRLGRMVDGGEQRADLPDADLCLDPPDGFPADQRYACCTRLIADGDQAMRARFHNARGLALRDLGRHEEARREIDAAIAIEAKPLFLCNRAYIAGKAGDMDAALADLTRALEIDPDYARAYEDRADLYEDLDRPEDGLRDIAQALRKPTAYRYRLQGRLLMQFPRYEEAAASFTASLEIEPGNPNALERRATCFLMLDRYPEAVADAQAALASKPDMPRAHLALATALDTDDAPRALRHFDVSLAADPEDGPTLNNRANVRSKVGDHAGAGADFDRAVALMPEEPIFRNNRALWRIEAGDFAGAAADLDAGLARERGDASMLVARAHLAVIAGETDEAEAILSRVLAHLPDYADAHAVTGWARLAQRRFQEAAVAFERALAQPIGRGPGKQNHRVRWTSLYGRGLARKGLGDAGGADDRASARALRPDVAQVVARWGQESAEAAPALH